MTIEKLSADEISGLLGQKRTEENTMPKNLWTSVENDALVELLSVSLGGSSAVLSSIFSKPITITAPVLSMKEKDELFTNTLSPFFVVLGEYKGGINGLQILSVDKNIVQRMVSQLDSSSEENDMEKQFQVLQQVVEQMFTSVAQSMSTLLEQDVAHSLSGMDVIDKQQDFPVAKFTKEEWFIEADFVLKLNNNESISFHLCLPVTLAKQMVEILIDSLGEEDSEETQAMPFQSSNSGNTNNNERISSAAPTIQSVQFSSFDDIAAAPSEPNNLNMLLDIPLQVTVELGRTKRMVKEILEVSQGSIIELDKLAGEPVDILINNKLIAVGEVVVIDENFGVRVTDILSTADRISKLR